MLLMLPLLLPPPAPLLLVVVRGGGGGGAGGGGTHKAVFAQLANELYATQRTVHDYYAELCAKYGHFVSCNHYYRATDPVLQASIFDAIRGPRSEYDA